MPILANRPAVAAVLYSPNGRCTHCQFGSDQRRNTSAIVTCRQNSDGAGGAVPRWRLDLQQVQLPGCDLHAHHTPTTAAARSIAGMIFEPILFGQNSKTRMVIAGPVSTLSGLI